MQDLLVDFCLESFACNAIFLQCSTVRLLMRRVWPSRSIFLMNQTVLSCPPHLYAAFCLNLTPIFANV